MESMTNHPEPILQVLQHKSSSYSPRTAENALGADLTVAFAQDYSTAGERLTKKMAGAKFVAVPLGQPPVEAARLLYKALKYHDARVLNVAGNGIYTLQANWTQSSLNQWVYQVLALVHKHWPLETVRSGCQTGADLAGLVAAYACGVRKVIALLPHGFIQRGADGIDREHSQSEIREQILAGARALSI